jgi:hypothetical protein
MYDHFARLTILLNLENHVDAGIRPIKNVLQLSKLLFDMKTNGRRNFDVTAGIFKHHPVLPPPRFTTPRDQGDAHSS